MPKWQVSSNHVVGVGIFYQVYRLRSVCAVDHAGNREYRGGLFDTEAEAQLYADQLNREEGDQE